MDWKKDPYKVLKPHQRPTDPNDDYYTKPFKTKSGRKVYRSKEAYDDSMLSLSEHTCYLSDPEVRARALTPEARAKAAQTRARNNAYKKAAKLIAELPLSLRKDDDLLLRIFKGFGVANPTMADGVMLAQVLKAQSGDTAAATFVRDTAGEKPTNSLEVSALDKPIEETNLAELSDAELEELAAAEADDEVGYLPDDSASEPIATFTDVPDWVEDALDS